MNQSNMDDKIRDIFGALDEQDLSAAMKRKDRIWSKVDTKKTQSKSNQWWLLLLLGSVVFTAGWLLKPERLIETAPKVIPVLKQSDNSLQFAINQLKSSLSTKEKSIDSLLALNASLSQSVLDISQNTSQSETAQQEYNPRIIRDTIYITEVKTERIIVEKVIRDTITLELPTLKNIEEPMADATESTAEDSKEEGSDSEKSTLPSSVQFNFSETNIDK